MIRFSMIRRLPDWFKELSPQRKIFIISLIALFILFLPILYHGVTWIYNSKACSVKGGEWMRVGIAQNPACIYTYPDAGKACKSSDECIGECVIYDPPIKGQPISGGVCEADNTPYGCFAVIEHPETYGCTD